MLGGPRERSGCPPPSGSFTPPLCGLVLLRRSQFAVYGLLELWGAPRFYDKLLCVPILNLSVLLLDRLAVPRRSPAPQDLGHSVATTSRANLAYMAVWVGLFGWMSATDFVGTQHPGRTPTFWQQACGNQLHNACRNFRWILRNTCVRGDANACMDDAALLGRMPELSDDPSTELRALARACDLGLARGCEVLVDKVTSEGVGALQSSCQADDRDGCYALGSIHLVGLWVPPDWAAALEYFSLSCELGLPTGCANVGNMYRYGVGVTQNPRRAAQSYGEACNRSFAQSCISLAELYSTGEGVPLDTGRERSLLRRACVLGRTDVCAG